MTAETDPEQDYRRAMAAFATGVTVVTAAGADGALSGMTVNSLTSVSLEPPLLLWCLGDKSARFDIFADAAVWGVTLLAGGAEVTARRFSIAETQDVEAGEAEMFAGVPVLRSGLAHLACRTHDKISAGDHLILIGAVIDMREKPGEALTFFRGGYGVIAGPATNARSKS